MRSRFDCPSASLSLRLLLRHMQHALWTGLGLALAIHLALSQLRGYGQERKVAKPLTTQFVKREPRLTKPLELKKRPQPKRRRMQRRMVSVKAKVSREEHTSQVQPVALIQGLARPQVDLSRGVSFLSAEMEPQTLAQQIRGTKEAEDTIDMSLEMLDIEALNTGRYDALVIQDPADKRNLRGFCHLSVLYIPREHNARTLGTHHGEDHFEEYVVDAVRHLSEAMNRYTSVKTDVLGRVQFGDDRLFKTPWLYTLMFRCYELSDAELEILGRYLMQGGFACFDSHPRTLEYGDVPMIHEQMLLGALNTQGIKALFEDIPNHHPMLHCYFDFDAPMGTHTCYGNPFLQGRLEGLEVDGRLVALASSMGYYSPWAGWGPDAPAHHSIWYQQADPTRYRQYGVNLIVFALTQEGSITSRVMDSVTY